MIISQILILKQKPMILFGHSLALLCQALQQTNFKFKKNEEKERIFWLSLSTRMVSIELAER